MLVSIHTLKLKYEFSQHLKGSRSDNLSEYYPTFYEFGSGYSNYWIKLFKVLKTISKKSAVTLEPFFDVDVAFSTKIFKIACKFNVNTVTHHRIDLKIV